MLDKLTLNENCLNLYFEENETERMFGCLGATLDVKLNSLGEKPRKLCNKIAKISPKFLTKLKMKE